jgi:hypothetical protein
VTAPIEVQCVMCSRPGYARLDEDRPHVVHLVGDYACELPPRVEPVKTLRVPRELTRWDDPW